MSRDTRLNSVQEEDRITKELKAKRAHNLRIINRLKEQIENQADFATWSVNYMKQIETKLCNAAEEFVRQATQLSVEYETSDEQKLEDEKTDDLVTKLMSKLLDRMDELAPKVVRVQEPKERQKVQIEVSHMDVVGNIKELTGTFDGDYSKWQLFRDRFVEAIDKNDKYKPVKKFQFLKAACVGASEGALGEWDLTEENYLKAWERLQSIYEDDYMQIQSFVKKLNKIPVIKNSSSKTIRDIIDTVHKHIHGLKRYVTLDEKHPYVVFTVIDRMDADTYRA